MSRPRKEVAEDSQVVVETGKEKIENITRIEKITNRGYHTLIRWKQNLDFPMFKEGGQWMMYREDYQSWLELQKNSPKR